MSLQLSAEQIDAISAKIDVQDDKSVSSTQIDGDDNEFNNTWDDDGNSSASKNDSEDQDQGENQDKDNEEGTKKKWRTPFHKHPRFKEMTLQNKRLQEENRKLAETTAKLIDKLQEAWFLEESDNLKEWLKNDQNDEELAISQIENKLEELREAWNVFEAKDLLELAVWFTSWDLDKAMILYKQIHKQNNWNSWKQKIDERKKAWEMIWTQWGQYSAWNWSKSVKKIDTSKMSISQLQNWLAENL